MQHACAKNRRAHRQKRQKRAKATGGTRACGGEAVDRWERGTGLSGIAGMRFGVERWGMDAPGKLPEREKGNTARLVRVESAETQNRAQERATTALA